MNNTIVLQASGNPHFVIRQIVGHSTPLGEWLARAVDEDRLWNSEREEALQLTCVALCAHVMTEDKMEIGKIESVTINGLVENYLQVEHDDLYALATELEQIAPRRHLHPKNSKRYDFFKKAVRGLTKSSNLEVAVNIAYILYLTLAILEDREQSEAAVMQ